MGASIWLIFLIPIMLIVNLFGNFFALITGKTQAEIVLPYDESKGIVWEYDNKDDFLIDFVEVRTEGNEQIFVFKGKNIFEFVKDTIVKEPIVKDTIGSCMDIVFTDRNGNKKTYYADFGLYNELLFYEESECIITEYTAIAKDVYKNYYWDTRDSSRVLIQPISYGSEYTFTIVCMPDDIKRLEEKEEFAFNPQFVYVNEEGTAGESIIVEYELVDGKLEINEEYRQDLIIDV